MSGGFSLVCGLGLHDVVPLEYGLFARCIRIALVLALAGRSCFGTGRHFGCCEMVRKGRKVGGDRGRNESIYRRGPEFCYLAREGPSEPRSRGEDDVCHSLPKAPVRHFVTVWSHFAFHSLTFT